MTVSAPSYVFPGNIDPSLMAETGRYAQTQWQYDPTGPDRLRSLTSSSAYGGFSSESLEVISTASEKMLESNGHFLRSKMIAQQSVSEIATMREVVASHVKENTELQAANNDLKVENKTLKEAIALFAQEYHEKGPSSGKVLSSIRSGNLPMKPPAKKREDCIPVELWSRKDFRRAVKALANANRGKTDGNATSAPRKGKGGRPRKSSEDDGKTTHFYLQNEDGSLVGEDQIAEMSRKARMIWRTLHDDDMAPDTFGQISMKAWEYFSRMMLTDESLEFLLLCDDGEWKLREWSTRSYPSWHRNRFAQPEKDAEGTQKKDKDTDRRSVTASDDDNTEAPHTGDTGNAEEQESQDTDDDINMEEQDPSANGNTGEQAPPEEDHNNEQDGEDSGSRGGPTPSNNAAAEESVRMEMFDPFNRNPATTATTTTTRDGDGTLSTASEGVRTETSNQDSPRLATDTTTTGLPANPNPNTLQPPPTGVSDENPRLDSATANSNAGKKRRAEGAPSTAPTKKQKRASAMAKTTASNSIRNICMTHWNKSQPGGQGLLLDFELYFKALSDVDKERFKTESRTAQTAARKSKTAAKKATDTSVQVASGSTV